MDILTHLCVKHVLKRLTFYAAILYQNEVLQIKGLKCLRPEEGGICQNAMVFYDDQDSAVPANKVEASLRDDIISSALKVCSVQQGFVVLDSAA